MIAALATAFVPTVALAPPPIVDTWYVDAASGSDTTGDGSVGNPFATITSALATASAGDTVVVGPGCYDQEEFPLEPTSGQTIVSSAGFDETTIDAGYNGSVFEITSQYEVTIEGFSIVRGDNMGGGGMMIASSGVHVKDCYFRDNISWWGGAIGIGNWEGMSQVVLDGCTFEHNGWLPEEYAQRSTVDMSPFAVEPEMPPEPDFDPSDVWNAWGGAVGCWDSSLTVTGCDFIDNAAGVAGGGLCAEETNLTVENTVFRDNVAYGEGFFGPAMSEYPATDDRDAPAPSEEHWGLKEYQNPLGESLGGGAYVWSSDALFDGVGFSRNFGSWGGGLFASYDVHCDIEDCTFDENSAIIGGAVATTDPDWIWEGMPGGEQAREAAMQDPGGYLEAAIESAWAFVEQQSPDGMMSVRRTSFTGNGGWDGIPAVFSYSYPNLYENCLFAQNVGAMSTCYLVDIEGGSWVNHCTFADNVTSEAALFMADEIEGPGFSFGEVSNSVFWGNRYDGEEPYDVYGPQAYFSDLEYGRMDPGPQMRDDVGPAIAIEGNICEDPHWLDPLAGDYRLTFGSPCVDTGIDWMEYGVPDDLEGLARPIDGDLDGEDGYDMGCYELDPRDAGTTERIWGENRWGTSVRTSQAYFPTADTVFIARGDVFADALTCAGLAGLFDAPVLLTRPLELPSEVANEIERLGADHAVLLGGPGAVSGTVSNELVGMGLTVERIGGEDRYDTAALIAERIAEETSETVPPVTFIARGDLPFDALAASPVANAIGAPILLVQPDELPPTTVDVLQQSPPLSTIIVGGKEAVNAHVAKSLTSAAIALDRIAGADRYATAVQVSQFAVGAGWSRWDVTGLATGLEFADALTGGAGIGRLGGVLLLTHPTTLSGPTRSALATHSEDIVRLDVLGGPNALSGAVKSEAADLVD